jgi:uncharacterized repeat protein (TIGR03803 family)
MRVLIVVTMIAAVFNVASGQEKVLYSFAGPPGDGSQPTSKLVFDSEGNVYGTTPTGGNGPDACRNSCGTVFELFELSPSAEGAWTETVLYNFCSDYNGYGDCLDGASPQGGLVVDSRGNLYGMTEMGGGSCAVESSGCGVVFELSPPISPGGDWSYSVLYSFCQAVGQGKCPDGALPYGKLGLDASGNLYGTTSVGGSGYGGVIFKLSPGTSSWTENVIYNFCATGQWPVCPDGEAPMAGVSFDNSGNLYGSTSAGGNGESKGGGVVYKLSPGGGGWTETVLYSFVSPYGVSGGQLYGAVNLDNSGNLYSTAAYGGKFGYGGVFRLSPKGDGSYGEHLFSLNGENGATPLAGVFLDSRNPSLYGTTSDSYDGSTTYGNVFRINEQGKQTILYAFTGGEDGGQPESALITDNAGNLYGTAKVGGAHGQGAVFEITH